MSARRPSLSRRGALLCALALPLLAACQDEVAGGTAERPVTQPEATDAIDFGPVADFDFEDQAGGRLARTDLLGRPWVLAFIFTTCAGPCPNLSRSMAELQEDFRETDLHLVSVSVDPAYDTPAVLARYARALGADPERWSFLHGTEEAVEALARELLLAVERRSPADDVPVGLHVTHSVKLVAVDREGKIRGWYPGDTRTGLERLRARLRHLCEEDS